MTKLFSDLSISDLLLCEQKTVQSAIWQLAELKDNCWYIKQPLLFQKYYPLEKQQQQYKMSQFKLIKKLRY